jgi:putative heme-binding domain-containing protein
MNYRFIRVSCSLKRAGQILALAAALAAGRAYADNPFADIVRKTEPKTPEEERKAFHLPPGFDIELVAAEPAIGKPINMAFDEKGRLWITQSREYPFPAPMDKPGRDKIQVLSDFDKKGHARKIVPFAEGLNIPIGLYPYKDGVIGYSIPYMYFFEDTTHDGHADTKEIVLGRFGYEKDTHGMTSSFRRGFDGWLYANHGFHNDSVLTARDGSSIAVNSGNTYRVHVDGSHIEQFTWGRVNPFGMMFDPLGNIYSSDCETFPIYELLRGGYYPSFGKPNDGLGFAPAMMDHKHGSTAIAGTVYYAATSFPPAFRDNIFVGNVMTCRIDRDSLIFHGSSPWAEEKPDFLACDDPWFRPVDLQIGPDGAMYVADFYNRIIGHYEVPLDHPGRDRERGRIWRITYNGEKTHNKIPAPVNSMDLTKASVSKLIKEMGNPNITIRMLAMNQLTDRIGLDAIKPVTKLMHDKKASEFQKIHGMWVLFRLKALDPKILADAATNPDRALRVHAMRVFAEMTDWTPEQRELVLHALSDSDALVVRCAADAAGRHPTLENMRPLLDAQLRTPTNDTHLLYVLRMAVRDQLKVPGIIDQLPLTQWNKGDEKFVADACLGTPNAESAVYLMKHLEKFEEDHDTTKNYLAHVVRFAPESEMEPMVKFIRAHFGDDLDYQLTLFQSAREATAQRGTAMNDAIKDWGKDIAAHLVTSLNDQSQLWANYHFEANGNQPNPWAYQERESKDGQKAKFFSSLPGGESLTGILRSKTFTIPEKLSFFIAGHDGPPDKPHQKKNMIRLMSADTHQVIKQELAPRIDIAQPVKWNLSTNAGRQGYLEIVDGDTGGAYAWIAVGRFEPEVVPMPATEPRAIEQRKIMLAQMVRDFKLAGYEPQLAAWLADKNESEDVRTSAARSLLAMNPEAHFAEVKSICLDSGESEVIREKAIGVLAELNTPASREIVVEMLETSPEYVLGKVAMSLANSADGAEKLLSLAETGKVPRRLLLPRKIQERVTAMKPVNCATRIEALTKGLPPLNAEIQKVINKRKAEFNPVKANADLGKKVFQQNCSVCHSINNQGGAVGPHLDGVGNRGLERLLEDVLDPSRNVDPAFRYSTLTLKDGTAFSGLQRREEGETIVFVDATGKETSFAKKDIESRVESQSSLMPDGFSEAIPLADFNNLMAFLLSTGSKTTASAK